MFITIAAAVTCVSAAVLPAAAELRRMLDERHSPARNLSIPTRRPKSVEPASEGTSDS